VGAEEIVSAKAVFLDRDGTINHDPGYLSDPAQMVLLSTVGEALALMKQCGFKLVVVSNQSGVGRGIIAADALPKIHARLDELLSKWSVRIDHYALCIHRPDEDCECRKPRPKLIRDAAAELGVDLAESYMIGDKTVDLGAGRAAGCKGSILVRTGYGTETERDLARSGEKPVFIADSLLAAATWIRDQESAGS